MVKSMESWCHWRDSVNRKTWCLATTTFGERKLWRRKMGGIFALAIDDMHEWVFAYGLLHRVDGIFSARFRNHWDLP
jgi:hypothetical protein